MASEKLGMIFAVIASVALVFATFTNHDTPRISLTDDLSASVAIGYEYLSGNPAWIGPPSHQGGRHLGPWYYLYVAWGLSPTGEVVTAIGMWSIAKLVAVGALALLAASLVPRSARAWAGGGVCMCAASTQYIQVLREGWHAHFFLLPVVASFIVFRWALEAPFRRMLWVLLVISLTVQTHYMGIVLLLGFFPPLLAAVREERHRAFGPPPWASWILPGLLIFVSWIPLALYEWQYGGALSGIIRGHLHGHDHAVTSSNLSPLRAAYEFFRMFSLSPHPLTTSLGTGYSRWAVVFLASTLCAAWLITTAISSVATKRFWIGSSLATLLTGLALAAISGPRHHYYLYSLLPLPALVIGTSLAGCVLLVSRHSRVAKFFGAGAFIGLIVLWARSFEQNLHRFNHLPFARWHTLEHAQIVANKIKEDRQNRGTTEPLVIVGRGETKISTNNYYAILERRGNPRMNYAEFFPEIPSFSTERYKTLQGYLIVCPRPPAHHRRAMWTDIKKRWPFHQQIELPYSRSTKNCELYLLSRVQEQGTITQKKRPIKRRSGNQLLPQESARNHRARPPYSHAAQAISAWLGE